MKKDVCRIDGSDRDALAATFTSVFGDPQFQSDHTVIFAVEKYYLRIDSNLLRVVIADFSSSPGCDVQVLVGGGKQGILGISLMAESDDLLETMQLLSQICDTNGWRFFRAGQTGTRAPK